MRPHHIAWLIFWLPVLAVNGAYAIGLWEGVASVCNPYIHGCTTISRAAREGSSIFLFRGLMMPVAVMLMAFWYMQSHWLAQLRQRSQYHIFIVGAIGALFLILYVDFLGTEGDFNRFMRRFGVIFYFGLTVLAQIMSLASLNKLGKQLEPRLKRLMNIQLAFIALCWIIAMINLAANAIGFDNITEIENVLEWHFALYMSMFFPFAAIMWRHTGFRWQFSQQR